MRFPGGALIGLLFSVGIFAAGRLNLNNARALRAENERGRRQVRHATGVCLVAAAALVGGVSVLLLVLWGISLLS